LLERLPGSLGTSTLALILSESRPLQVLSLNGVAPWVKGAVNPAYPLVKPLYLVLRDDAKPATRRFVAFIQSPEGRSILEKIGYSHALR
jgi:phosphate transport system substrate-binding protein